MLRRFERLPITLLMEADSGSGEGGAGNTDPQDPANTGGDGGASPSSGGATFTPEQQAKIDAIVQREKRKAAEAERKRIEDDAKAAAMTETDRLKAEKDAATKQAQDVINRANQRTIQAEARVQALAAGVKPERVAAALKLADLSAVEVDDAGEPDVATITAAVTAMLAEYPEFKVGAASGNVGGGSNPAGAGSKAPTLMEQYRAAQQAGNVPLMIALKRKLAEAAGS